LIQIQTVEAFSIVLNPNAITIELI